MTDPGRPKGYAPDSPATRALRRRPRRTFGSAPLQLQDADLRRLVPMTVPTGTDPPMPDVLDQQSTNSCFEHVVAQAVRCLAVRDNMPVELLSILSLYWEARAAVQDQGADDGTLPSAALGCIDQYGMAPARDWPMIPSNVLVPPPPEVYRDGWGSRGALIIAAITDVAGQREREIRDHLNRGNPVGIGLQIGASFEQGAVPVWTGDASILGGHYLLLLASRSDAAFCLSSWGLRFGQLGGLWVSWAQIEDPSVATDIIAFERILRSPGAS